jgi:hypothetical protein
MREMRLFVTCCHFNHCHSGSCDNFHTVARFISIAEGNFVHEVLPI